MLHPEDTQEKGEVDHQAGYQQRANSPTDFLELPAFGDGGQCQQAPDNSVAVLDVGDDAPPYGYSNHQ